MQKLGILKPVPLLRANGGEIALIERLQLFQSWGMELKIICALHSEQESLIHRLIEEFQFEKTPLGYRIGSLEVHCFYDQGFHPFDLKLRAKTEEFFINQLRQFEADLALTHYTDYFASSAALRWDASRTWIDQTDNEFPRLERLKEFGDLAEIYSRSQHFSVASQFMATQVGKSFPKAGIHLLPNILSDFDRPQVQSREFDSQLPWLFVNPAAVKGIDFLMELAKKMPNENFLICGNWGSSAPLNLPKNVQSLSRQNSLSPIWPRVKGLLMPSQWEEAFGRMPLEAMAHGAVVIASQRGGLPESVGTGGLCLPLELSLWSQEISKPAPFWNVMIQRGFEQFLKYRRFVDETYDALRSDWKPGVRAKA